MSWSCGRKYMGIKNCLPIFSRFPTSVGQECWFFVRKFHIFYIFCMTFPFSQFLQLRGLVAKRNQCHLILKKAATVTTKMMALRRCLMTWSIGKTYLFFHFPLHPWERRCGKKDFLRFVLKYRNFVSECNVSTYFGIKLDQSAWKTSKYKNEQGKYRHMEKRTV